MTIITLNQIRRFNPRKQLLERLSKTSESLTLATVLESSGLDDAIWCLRVLPASELHDIQQFAIRAANTVRHLMSDSRSTRALDVAQRYLDGGATFDELRAAAEAAAYAPCAADAATRATRAAIRAAYTADAADAAYAAYAVTRAVTRAAACAADAARAAYAADAARTTGAAAEIEKIFKEMFCKRT